MAYASALAAIPRFLLLAGWEHVQRTLLDSYRR